MDKQVVKRLLKFTKPYIGYLIMALICALFSVTFTLLGPVLIGKGIDLIIGPNNVDFNGILKIIVILMATIILGALFQWLMGLYTNIVTQKTVKDLRIASFSKINEVPLRYIDSNPHGDIINRVVNDIDLISDGLLQGFTQLFTGIVTIVGTLLFMLSINVSIALVVVLVTPLSLFVASFIAKKSHNSFKVQSATRGELSGYIEEILGNQKVVKAFSYEDEAEEKFKEINARLYESGVKSQFYSSLTNPSTRFVNGIVYAAVGVIGALLAIKGKLTIGDISCFLSYANQYTKPFNEISGVVTELQTAFASAKRVFNLLDELPETPEDKDAISLVKADGYLEINNVNFSYSENKKLIENLNLKVKPGNRIAIVGPTGCGKTTIINLLMRFYDVTSGEIKVDNTNITHLTREGLRRNFGMVLQDTWLYSGTVKENIAYGKVDATDEEIIEAAKAAHAHNFIMRLPNGYDTLINDDGSNISQGQKQLLCIARVMLTKPPMLILDEATSSIDTRTEIYIQKAFDKMMEGRTSFIVAHRLSTIKEADLILVMNAGKIIEQGKHEQLLAANGFYANLYNSQFIKE
ncbi:ABC transporter ATP-binding protein [Clostridium paraputrificum]|uniref:ABC transporter ATP-binding protein n=1 Tax=Clostridium TaxID=1485 RepID=UPI00189CAEE7|nr:MULTISPECIES: ABC transporter ATP-binding protein [Clostridium]MBS7131326.1 ABC transporter ATP-binding protein [Clostridium sp.]MDB2076311.1 ABC transporter ATP-binding protein [Clostridium paraputrificum]MDB2079751.1 ABC transporter ATP-binding protein [Clostridium paraputrificum]MDB2086165.1 ABC transporter ATP-binding protein [Clostridium paraputrificum]MDB2101050.1 ABC transporter ATP-binding protein [Clostridium paraputrificum]